MLKRDVDKLNNNRLLLVRHLKLSDDFYHVLRIEDGILNEELESEIRERPQQSRVGYLLDVISKRGQHSFDAFLNAMYVTGQQHLLEELEHDFNSRKISLESLNVMMKKDDLKVQKTLGALNVLPAEIKASHREGIHQARELQGHSSKITISAVSNTNQPDVDQIVDNIIYRTELSHSARDYQMLESTKRASLPWDIFCLRSKFEYLAGEDLDCLYYFKTVSQIKQNKFHKHINSPKDLRKYFNEIATIVKANSLLSCTILIDSENNSDSLILEEGSILVSEVIATIKDLIQIDSVIIMMCFYGSNHFNLESFSVAGNEAKKCVVTISRIANNEERRHWMLWTLVECFKAFQSSEYLLEDIFLLVNEVGKKCLERNIISQFYYFDGLVLNE